MQTLLKGLRIILFFILFSFAAQSRFPDIDSALQADLKEGYTINEDNVIYETYPHQVNMKWIENYLHYLSKPKEK